MTPVHDPSNADLDYYFGCYSFFLVVPFFSAGTRRQGVEKDMAQLEDQADDHVNDSAGLTNKVEKGDEK